MPVTRARCAPAPRPPGPCCARSAARRPDRLGQFRQVGGDLPRGRRPAGAVVHDVVGPAGEAVQRVDRRPLGPRSAAGWRGSTSGRARALSSPAARVGGAQPGIGEPGGVQFRADHEWLRWPGRSRRPRGAGRHAASVRPAGAAAGRGRCRAGDPVRGEPPGDQHGRARRRRAWCRSRPAPRCPCRAAGCPAGTGRSAGTVCATENGVPATSPWRGPVGRRDHLAHVDRRRPGPGSPALASTVSSWSR